MAYASKTPDARGRFHYDAEEAAVWRQLFERQMKELRGRIAPAFLDGVARLGLTAEQVPQIVDIDRRLGALSGAGVEAVPAIIPPARFFALLAERRFPVASFLRRREDIDYIEEPDLFHEVFGHCPLLTDPAYADFIQRFGRVAQALGKGYSWRLFRLFWFTIEFGLIRTPDGPRGYGAGIASSPAEAAHAIGGGAALEDFDLLTVFRTPYRIDILQPVCFVIDSFEDLSAALDEDIAGLIDTARAMGDLPARFETAA